VSERQPNAHYDSASTEDYTPATWQ